MWLDKLKASAWMLAALASAALLATQTVRLHTEQGAHQALQTKTATADAARSEALLKNAPAPAAPPAPTPPAIPAPSNGLAHWLRMRIEFLTRKRN